MTISKSDWDKYVKRMSSLSKTAGEKLQQYAWTYGIDDVDALIQYAQALVTKYGEGSAELACAMYDEIAELSGEILPSAIPAVTATYQETAKAVQGSLLQSPEGKLLNSVAQRLVKQAGADTITQNAIRDRAEWAWVPVGDTCPFCLTLASRGWQRASESQLKGGHATHIHANCNCQFTVRFNEKDGVAGYEPEKYRKIYESAEGNSSKAKINFMRRQQASD